MIRFTYARDVRHDPYVTYGCAGSSVDAYLIHTWMNRFTYAGICLYVT